MSEMLKAHWPSGIILMFLIAIVGFLVPDKLRTFEKADAACIEQVNRVTETQKQVCSRIDRLETTLPFILKTTEKNVTTLEGMAKDLQDIKILIRETVARQKGERRNEYLNK